VISKKTARQDQLQDESKCRCRGLDSTKSATKDGVIELAN